MTTRLKFWSVQAPKGNYGHITVLAPTDVEAIRTVHAAGHLQHTIAVGTYAPTVGGHKGSAGLKVPVSLHQNLFLCSQEPKPARVILAQTKATRQHRTYQEEIVEILTPESEP